MGVEGGAVEQKASKQAYPKVMMEQRIEEGGCSMVFRLLNSAGFVTVLRSLNAVEWNLGRAVIA
jgi:hypothetical protein